MQKFTIKTYEDTRDYEICDYPYADTWQYLKITKYHKGKYCGEESIDLSEINPETVLMKKIGASFLKSEKIPAVKKILLKNSSADCVKHIKILKLTNNHE